MSLLRSEQDAERPIVGNPETFETLLGPDARLFRMRDALMTVTMKSMRLWTSQTQNRVGSGKSTRSQRAVSPGERREGVLDGAA